MTRPSLEELDAPPEPDGSRELLVFFDTEFTSFESPLLLSIGMVAESGEELYIEIVHAKENVISDFVGHEVLPLFGLHDPQVLEFDAIAARLERWFDSLRSGDRDIGIALISDHFIDWMLVLELRIPNPGEPSWTRAINVGGRLVQHIFASDRQMAAYLGGIERFHQTHKQRHHALIDARAMKYAYGKARF